MESKKKAMTISEKPIIKKGIMRTFKPSPVANRTLQQKKEKVLRSLNKTEGDTWTGSSISPVEKQLEHEVGLNYSTVEYLCKNIKAKKGLGWILSLRSNIGQSNLPKIKEEPFGFWNDEMLKWKDKFAKSNQSLEEDMAKIRRSYHYNFFVPPKKKDLNTTCSKFSTVDSLLLSGNNSQLSHCVENRKLGSPHKSDINFACLLRNYSNEGSLKDIPRGNWKYPLLGQSFKLYLTTSNISSFGAREVSNHRYSEKSKYESDPFRNQGWELHELLLDGKPAREQGDDSRSPSCETDSEVEKG